MASKNKNTIRINHEVFDVINSEIKYISATHNNISGYSILVNIDVNIKEIRGT